MIKRRIEKDRKDVNIAKNIEQYEEKVEIMEEKQIQPYYEITGIISDMKKDVEVQQIYVETLEQMEEKNRELEYKLRNKNQLILIILIVLVVFIALILFGII